MSKTSKDATTLLHKAKLAVMLRDVIKMNANKKELATRQSNH